MRGTSSCLFKGREFPNKERGTISANSNTICACDVQEIAGDQGGWRGLGGKWGKEF